MKTSRTVLLVDQDKNVIESVRRVTESMGIRFLHAENGQDGFDIARSVVPDLVIIRRNAPVLDALSLSVLLKQSENTGKIIVIVICTGASPGERECFQDAGCSGCLEEPFTDKDLQKKMEGWLP
ncbi:MAG TPA: response regulator [Thermodesulfobacteriaceae bacterium]|nr:response regulator [Thermodesulfobacteriaceae bacterium]